MTKKLLIALILGVALIVLPCLARADGPALPPNMCVQFETWSESIQMLYMESIVNSLSVEGDTTFNLCARKRTEKARNVVIKQCKAGDSFEKSLDTARRVVKTLCYQTKTNAVYAPWTVR